MAKYRSFHVIRSDGGGLRVEGAVLQVAVASAPWSWMEEPQRMNKSAGAVSKECIAHHYWHHMDDPKCFFKIMIGDFKNGMTIPKKFVANIREKISEQVTLQVPDGKTYTVEVAEDQQELVLRSGWAEFSSTYKLELGDFLVFTNSGNSHLAVRIFDRSCCEKELSCVPLDSILCMQEWKGSHGKQMQTPTGKRLADGSPSGSIRKTRKMNPTDSPSPQKKTGHVPSSEEGVHQEPINSGASQKLIKSCIALPTGCSMTSEQEAKVISLEEKIQPKIPFYITAMYKESLASGILSISKKYVMEHLANKNGTIQVCQLDGSNVWTINLYITSDPHYAVSTGWLEFIHDNKSGEGDICIFQPERRKNDRVKLIFHSLEESCCLQSSAHVSPTKRHRADKTPYMLACKASLTDEQRSKVEEKLRGIQSEIPVYVTVIKNSNINVSSSPCILEFSVEYARKYLLGGDKSQLTMTMRLRCPGRSKDDEWEPEFRAKSGRYRIAGQCWRKFVTDNKLKLDDICLFNLRNTKTLRMDVHIIQ